MVSFGVILVIYTLIFYSVEHTLLVTKLGTLSSPCPDVFQYDTQPNGYVYGKIKIPYDGSPNLHLTVNASMKGYYTNSKEVSLKIKMVTPGRDLAEQKTKIVSYDIYFPFQHVIPRITRIEYNGRTYCSGPSEQLTAGAGGITNVWSGHKYYFEYGNRNEFSDQAPQLSPPTENIKPIMGHQRIPDVTSTPFLQFNRKKECGISSKAIVPLILGGKEISEGMFPWLVAMFTTNGNGYEYKCTANLISERHIITAARCVSFFKLQVVQTDDMLFVFGKSQLRNWATDSVTRGAAAVQTNPEFNANSGHGDVTVITLDRPVEFSSTIAPICLWDDDVNIENIEDKYGTVAGWGADEGAQTSGKDSISVAKSVEMPVVSQDGCLYSNLSYFQLTSEITFCAGRRDGRGTCIGDSGAGFMLNKNGKFYLRGLASIVLSDNGKCDLHNFMIFCDVAKLKDWIGDCMRR